MATDSKETKQAKSLPAPNSDFYDVRSILSPEEQDIVRQVREFAEAKVAPVISKYWLEDAFPFELLPELKKQACLSGADAIAEIQERSTRHIENRGYHVTATGIKFKE